MFTVRSNGLEGQTIFHKILGPGTIKIRNKFPVTDQRRHPPLSFSPLHCSSIPASPALTPWEGGQPSCQSFFLVGILHGSPLRHGLSTTSLHAQLLLWGTRGVHFNWSLIWFTDPLEAYLLSYSYFNGHFLHFLSRSFLPYFCLEFLYAFLLGIMSLLGLPYSLKVLHGERMPALLQVLYPADVIKPSLTVLSLLTVHFLPNLRHPSLVSFWI